VNAAQGIARQVGVAPGCRALGVSRATFYRKTRPETGQQQPRKTPARALSPGEREAVRGVLHAPRFVDRSPGEIVATLLDEQAYLCSERTMYRVLAEEGASRERRNQLRHPSYTKPELVATAPDEVWTWDITKLLGPRKWIYYYLYVILDLFSRYVVGWMVAEKENASLAARLIEESCRKHAVRPEILTLHSDRGSPMTAKCTAQLLADLGVTQSLSRPRVSDDNPFSEAQFKTVKYHPGFPGRFAGQPDAIDSCRSFFPCTTTSIAMRGSRCSRRRTSTSGGPPRSWLSDSRSWTKPTRPDPTASPVAGPRGRPCPKRSTSTRPRRIDRKEVLTKFDRRVSQSRWQVPAREGPRNSGV